MQQGKFVLNEHMKQVNNSLISTGLEPRMICEANFDTQSLKKFEKNIRFSIEFDVNICYR